ncbi:hypothetical protein Tco_0707259 [Tanacetum coccineum]|uniref:Uncharacterized protein n=1 Tax=Tanacetum coccineum TaxID=301880 RepID=A0ABQ4YBW3_9ASTR
MVFHTTEKKFKQLESDEELARKMQEEWEEEEERTRAVEEKAANEDLIRNFDDIKARIEADRLLAEKLQEQEREQFTIEERAKFLHDTIAAQRKFLAQQRSEAIRKQTSTQEITKNPNDDLLEAYLNAVYQLVMDRFQDEMPEGFDRVLWGDLMVLFNPDDKDEFWNSQLDWKIVSWKLHSSSGVHTLVTKEGVVIHMLVEKKYPLRKEVLMQMLKLKLESEEDSTMALELIKFVKKILAELEPEEHKNWLVHKQTACGKDFSNPFMVDNLPKIVRFSTHLASVVN